MVKMGEDISKMVKYEDPCSYSPSATVIRQPSMDKIAFGGVLGFR